MNEQILTLINELGEERAIRALDREIKLIKRIEKNKQQEIEDSKKIKHIDLEKARIEELDLPGAIYMGLLNIKVFNVKDLIKYTREELLKVKRLTEYRVSKIEEQLKKFGLKLK